MRHGKYVKKNELNPYYYVNRSQDQFPSGTIVMRDTACPSGWTQFSTLDERFIKGGSYVLNAGGNSSHTHQVSQTHTHEISGTSDDTDPLDLTADDDTAILTSTYAAHSHTISGTTGSTAQSGISGSVDNNLLIPRVSFIFCKKD
jgi:hypothetical protein